MVGLDLVESKFEPTRGRLQPGKFQQESPWIHPLRKGGSIFRIVDLHGNQAVDTLFYNEHDYSDRYSAQDTIQQQGNIYLTTGTKLMSAGGTVLLTIVGGHLRPPRHAGRRRAATESNMVRYALEKRHMHACRNSFMKSGNGVGPRHEQSATSSATLIFL